MARLFSQMLDFQFKECSILFYSEDLLNHISTVDRINSQISLLNIRTAESHLLSYSNCFFLSLMKSTLHSILADKL